MFSFLTPSYISTIIFVVVLVELLIALFIDLKTAKVPNKFNLIFLAINISLVILLRSLAGLYIGVPSFFIAFAILTPVYLLKILGGGDIKLMLAVSPFLLLEELIGFIFMSLLWGGVFGIIATSVGGNLRALLTNTLLATKKVTVAENKIPFTFGILLGWLSYKTFLMAGLI